MAIPVPNASVVVAPSIVALCTSGSRPKASGIHSVLYPSASTVRAKPTASVAANRSQIAHTARGPRPYGADGTFAWAAT